MKKIFCRKHTHMCHLKYLLWWVANFHLYENINEIFHELKNLVKNRNCIIAKWGKIITKCGSCLWLQSRAVYLQSITDRKLKSKAKKIQSAAGITKRRREITKWGKYYKVGYYICFWNSLTEVWVGDNNVLLL